MQRVGNIVGGKRIAGPDVRLAAVGEHRQRRRSRRSTTRTGNLTVDTGDPANRRSCRSTTRTAASAGRRARTRGSASTTRTRRSMPAPATRCASRARDPTRRRTTRCARRQNRPKLDRTPGDHCRNFSRRRRRRRCRAAASSPSPRAGQVYCAQFVMPDAPRAATTTPARTPASRPRSRSATSSPTPARWCTDAGGRLRLGPHDRGEHRHLHAARHAAQLPGDRRVRRRHAPTRTPPRSTAPPQETAGPDLPRGRDDRRQDAGRHLHARTSTRRRARSRNRWVTPFEMTGENQAGHARSRRHHHAEHRRPAAARPAAGDEGADRPAQPADAHHPGRRSARCARRSRRPTTPRQRRADHAWTTA